MGVGREKEESLGVGREEEESLAVGSEECLAVGSEESLEVGSVKMGAGGLGAGAGLQPPSSPTTTGPRPCWEGSEESWRGMVTGGGEELAGVGETEFFII